MELRGVVKVVDPRLAAEITAWRNNCAVSSASIFLINNLLSNKLSKEAEVDLLNYFNGYYNTKLSLEDLSDVFKSIFLLPSERQVVLGPVLRDFIEENGLKEGNLSSEEGMLSDKAFRVLGEGFNFNVDFYTYQKNINNTGINGIYKSSAIKEVKVSSDLTLKIYFKGKHYSLIMDDEKEVKDHNIAGFQPNSYDLPIEKGLENDLKIKVRGVVENKLEELERMRELEKKRTFEGDEKLAKRLHKEELDEVSKEKEQIDEDEEYARRLSEEEDDSSESSVRSDSDLSEGGEEDGRKDTSYCSIQ